MAQTSLWWRKLLIVYIDRVNNMIKQDRDQKARIICACNSPNKETVAMMDGWNMQVISDVSRQRSAHEVVICWWRSEREVLCTSKLECCGRKRTWGVIG